MMDLLDIKYLADNLETVLGLARRHAEEKRDHIDTPNGQRIFDGHSEAISSVVDFFSQRLRFNLVIDGE